MQWPKPLLLAFLTFALAGCGLCGNGNGYPGCPASGGESYTGQEPAKTVSQPAYTCIAEQPSEGIDRISITLVERAVDSMDLSVTIMGDDWTQSGAFSAVKDSSGLYRGQNTNADGITFSLSSEPKMKASLVLDGVFYDPLVLECVKGGDQ